MVDRAHIDKIDLNEWQQQPLESRALTLGTIGVKSQTVPHLMSTEEWFLLGLAQTDQEAVDFLQQDANDHALGVNFEEIFSPDAAMNAIMTNENVNGVQKGQYWKSYTSGMATHQHTWVDTAVDVGATVALWSVVAATTALAAPAGAAGVGWATASIAGRSVALGGAGWAGSTAGMQSLLTAMNGTGWSMFAHTLRAGGVRALAGPLSVGAVGSAATFEIIDALQASYSGNPEGMLEENARNIRLADLQREGYTIEVAGVAADEEMLYALEATDDDIIIRDADGNVVGSDERAQLLEGTDTLSPEEFAAQNAEGGGAAIDAPTLGPQTQPTVFGVAPQYAGLNPGVVDLDAAFAAAEEKLPGYGPDGKMTLEEYMDARYAADPFLAVPRDYRKSQYGTDAQLLEESASLQDAGVPWTVSEAYRTHGTPVYSVSSVMDEVAKWDAFTIIDFQNKAIEAGLINPDSTVNGASFVPGSADPHTLRALEGAMAQANVNGNNQTYWDAMGIMIQGRKDFEEKFGSKTKTPTWAPSRAYMKPDYATISQNVKGMMSRELGRDPNDWEMELLADVWRTNHRAKYDADMAAEKAAFDNAVRARETGEVSVPAAGQEVDYAARVQEAFDDEFSDELDARDRWRGVQSKTSNLFGSFGNLSNA